MGGSDWTRGAAKWGAAILLGSASLAGMTWSLSGQRIARVQNAGPIPVAHPVEKPEFVTAARTPASPSARQLDKSGAKPEAAPAAEEPKQSAGLPQGTSPPAAPGTHKVNINTAAQSELELLPGIGPAMAKRIIDYRTQHGKFTSIEQLDSVRGVGAKTMERLRPLVTIE